MSVSAARPSFGLSLSLCALLACGGGDDSPGQVGVERPPAMDAALPIPDAQTADDAGDDPALADSGPANDAARPIPCDDDACEAMSDPCIVAACNHAIEACELSARDDGTPCGDATSTECSGPNVCNSGTCVANDLPAGTPCGQTGVVCRVDDQCDGGGQCVSFGLAPAGSACGSAADTDCDAPDTCDAFGTCQPNYADADHPCGTTGVLCHYDDYCDGSGNCAVYGPLNIDSNCPPDYPAVAGFGCSCSPSNRDSCTPDICVNGLCTPRVLDENHACGPGDTLCCDSSQNCGDCI
jgi:hypothetical protein